MRAGGSKHSRALAGAFFALVAAILVGSAKPGIRGYDAQHRFAQLAEWRSAAGGGEADGGATDDGAAPTGEAATVGGAASEAVDRKYGVALPLLAVPLHLAGEALDAWSGDAGGSAPRSAVAQFNHLVTFAFCVWVWRWHRSRLGASAANAAAGVLLVLATSWILAHGKDFYAEVLWSALACVFLDAVTASRPVSAGLVAALMVWVNPALAPVAALAAAAAGAGGGAGRRAALGAAGLGICCGLLANGIENAVERGRFMDGGYGDETFLWQPARMLDLLVSPGRGLLLFAPACLAIPAVLMRAGATPADDYVRRFFRGAALFIAGLVVLYGSWCWWCGGYFFGPRFLLAASVLASLALPPAWSRTRSDPERGVLAVLVAGSAFTAWFGLTAGHRFAEDCRFAADASHRGWNESPFWLFTQPPEVWRELLAHRGTIALAVGLTCGTMLRRFLRSPEKEWK